SSRDNRTGAGSDPCCTFCTSCTASLPIEQALIDGPSMTGATASRRPLARVCEYDRDSWKLGFHHAGRRDVIPVIPDLGVRPLCAGQKADFVQAYNHLMRSRAAELVARQYQVTPEQIQGIMDGRVRVPQPIADALRQEERDLYRSAFQSGQDPAAQIYSYATMRGYRAPAPAPAAPAGTPGTPLGGGAPAAAPRAPAQGAPTATDVVASIQRGQPAAASLSRAGGGPTDTELTPQALAEMSDDRFAEILNELQGSGRQREAQAALRALTGGWR